MRVMLCQPSKHLHKIKYPAYAQEKADGARILIYKTVEGVKMFTRRGNEYTKLPELAASLSQLPTGYVYDGELLFGDLERKTSNGLARKAQRDGKISVEEAVLAHVKLWDMIPIESYDRGICAVSYCDRWEELLDLTSHNIPKVRHISTMFVNNEDQALSLYHACLEHGYEGIVLKNEYGIWEDKRSYDCIKMKAELTCDLRIVDVQEGKGKAAFMAGAIKCVSDGGEIEVWVGSGLKDEQRIQIWEHFLADYCGKICEVKFNQLIKAQGRATYSLYLPVFGQMRFDKTSTTLIEELI